jgi:hypothetical protein
VDVCPLGPEDEDDEGFFISPLEEPLTDEEIKQAWQKARP